MDKVHPIQLIAQNDHDLNTILHSFFLFHYEAETSSLVIDCRHPQVRREMDSVEEGLQGLVLESLNLSSSKAQVSNLIISNHSGRFYVFTKKVKNKVFALVSTFAIFSFCRSLLDALESQQGEECSLPLLCCLCDLPLFRMPEITYKFRLPNEQLLSIQFSSLSYIHDLDVDLVLQFALTPAMIVKAWEALLIESRLLVISKFSAVLLPCCEFLRRLIAPMPYTGTFIPTLPPTWFEAIEAPGTFIIGAEMDAQRASTMNLSGMIVLDLDRQSIIDLSAPAAPHTKAPPFLTTKLTQKVRTIMMDPVVSWCGRSRNGGPKEPHSTTQLHHTTELILELFSEVNLTLFSAQLCYIKAFFRSSFQPMQHVADCFRGLDQARDLIARSPVISFSKLFDITVGCLQRWIDVDVDNSEALHHTVHCWLEMDSAALAIYDFADDLPRIVIRIEEMEAVLGSFVEPDGCVFEIQLFSQRIYRFTTTDRDSRQLWMSMIEERIKAVHQVHVVLSAASCDRQATGGGIDLSALDNVPSDPPSSSHVTSDGRAPNIYHRFVEPIAPLAVTEPNDFSDPETFCDLFRFRDVIRSSQLMANLYSLTDCPSYASLLSERGDCLLQYALHNGDHEERLRRYMRRLGHTGDILHHLQKHLATNPSSESQIKNPEEGNSEDKDSMLWYGPAAQSADSSKSQWTLTDIEAALKELDGDVCNSPVNSAQHGHSHNALSLTKEALAITSSAHNRCLSDLSHQMVMDRIEAMKTYFKRLPLSVGEGSAMPTPEIFFDLGSLSKAIVQHLETEPCLSPMNMTCGLTSPLANRKAVIDALHASIPPSEGKNSWLVYDRVKSAFTALTGFVGGSTASLTPPRSLSLGEADITDRTISTSSVSHSDTPLEGGVEEAHQDDSNALADLQVDLQDQDSAGADGCLEEQYSLKLQRLIQKEISLCLEDLIATHMPSSVSATPSSSEDEEECVKKTKSDHFLRPVGDVLLGFVLHQMGKDEKALRTLARHNLCPPRLLSLTLLEMFIKQILHVRSAVSEGDRGDPSDDEAFRPLQFVVRAWKLHPTTGLHAFRLLLELLHSEQQSKLWQQEAKTKHTLYDRSAMLQESFRSLPRSGLTMDKAEKRSVSISMSGRFNRFQEFTWTEPVTKSPIVNETYICTRLDTTVHPCELSIDLLMRLREVLRSYSQTSAAAKYLNRAADGTCRLKADGDMLKDMQHLSAFKKFEIETCQLQKTDLTELNNNERAVFFINVFNTMIVHSMVRLIPQYNKISDFMTFHHMAKYNIGGLVYSLMDIKQGILQSSMTAPQILSPFPTDLRFNQKDPRRRYSLTNPIPYLTFCLNQGIASSPELCLLTDPSSLEVDIVNNAGSFLRRLAVFDIPHRTVVLPALCKPFWADFGKKKEELLRDLAATMGPEYVEKMKQMAGSFRRRVKMTFATYDLTPTFIFTDNM